MSNCVITLEIAEYQPESINFDTFAFVFKSDTKDFEEEITFSNKNTILHISPLRKKDLKYNIKITKAGSLIGIAEFNIPYSNLTKKEEFYSKLCQITMTDSMKRLIFGSITATNTIKILVKASIQYVDKVNTLKQSHSLPKKDMNQFPLSPKNNIQSKPQLDIVKDVAPVRETKTPPINTLKKSNNKPTAGVKKPTLTNHKSHPNTKQLSPNLDASVNPIEQTSSINATPVIYSTSQIDPFDTSIIDPFIAEEMIQIDQKFNEFITKCTADLNASDMNSLTDLNGLLLKTKESIASIFKLQQEYYKKMSKSIEGNNKLRELLLKYNEKYRSIVKKQNRLKEQMESNGFRKEIAVTLRPEESERTKELIPIKKHELKIYQNVFNKFYLDSDIETFKVVNNLTKEQSLLVLALKNVIKTYGNLVKLSPNLKEGIYKELVLKYALLYPDAASLQTNNVLSSSEKMPMNLIPEAKVHEETKKEVNDQYKEVPKPKEALNPKEEIPQPKEEVVVFKEEEFKKEEESKKEEIKQQQEEVGEPKEGIVYSEKDMESKDKVDFEMENVISLLPDVTDIKLNHYLTFFYTKRKIVRIPFKKTSTNNYEYGSQKIMIKMEGETFRVRNVGGYNLLDKFIETNAPIEEAKMKNPKVPATGPKSITKGKKPINASKK